MPGEKSVTGSIRSLVGTLRSWQKKKRGELRYAVVRHAERADSCWNSDWCFGEDAQAYPFDPPLTPNGVQQAKACGARLQELEPPQGGWSAVVCSPFLRCIQTALEICKATGASLIIDQDWGEVRFPEMLDTEMSDKQQGLTRPYQYLAGYVEQEGVKLRNPDSPCGNVWHEKLPESLQDARERYARKFVLCLDRAILSQTSVIVVSHGESLPGCLPLFSDHRGCEVTSTPFCGMVVGRLDKYSTIKRRSKTLGITGTPSTTDAYAMSGILDGLSVIETTCEVRKVQAPPTQQRGHLPAWMRSRQVKFRAGSSSLMRALGMKNSFDSRRSKEWPSSQPMAQSILEEQPSVPMENMIDCNEVTKLDDDFEAGLQNLVELPAVPPKDVSSSQSQCIVGQSTLLLGDFVVGASTNFLEHESLRSLKSMDEFSNQAIDIGKYPSSENILQKISAVSECDIESAEFPKRRRADSEELSPRGRGPTQSRVPFHPSGCARRVGLRSFERSLTNAPEVILEKQLGMVHPEAYLSEPDIRASKGTGMSPEDDLSVPARRESSKNSRSSRSSKNSKSSKSTEPFAETNPFSPLRELSNPFSNNENLSPLPSSGPALGSSTAGDGRAGHFSERSQQSPRLKWSLSLSKNGRVSSVVPVFEDELPTGQSVPLRSSSSSSAATGGATVPVASPSVARPSTDARRASATSIPLNLSKLATNSLFQRRRSRASTESESSAAA
jgi:broad specificity phosphatase PhoE